MGSSVVSGAFTGSSISYTCKPPRATRTLVNTRSYCLISSSLPSSLVRSRVLRVSEGRKGLVIQAAEKMTTTTEKLGVKIQKNPPESKLTELGVRNWPKWGCPPSKFPWTYESKETCYLLKGKVKVYPDGAGSEAVEFGAGDLVEFPKGMSCTWDVSEAVDKHYKFE